MLTRTLLEEVGSTTWVKLRALTDEPLKLPKIVSSEGHSISKCIAMLSCPRHGSVWRNHSIEYRAAHRKVNPLPKRGKAAAK